jgi:Holliday junction DNA helicase RuvA
MIGKLKGLIDSYGEDFVILDVGGVGYQVHCSTRTLQALPSIGEAATLSIETYVREDQIKLFGFRTDAEREWFRLLLRKGRACRARHAAAGRACERDRAPR